MVSPRELYKVQSWYIPHLPIDTVNRILQATESAGVFLLRRDEDRARNVLSFLSEENAVCHVYMDQTDFLCMMGRGIHIFSPDFRQGEGPILS
jgi:hypothetical protein